MIASEEELFPYVRVSDFYDGKSVFLTGACGFLGMVILEALLRYFPGIHSIYILVRPKKGKDPEDRKELLLKKRLFDKLKDENPDVLQKIHVVPGDALLPNLGMSEGDYSRILQEVTIVFHCAAVISFSRSLRYILTQNSVCTDNVINFCRKLKKLDVFVYTSTAMCNSNRNCEILERVYRLPFHAQTLLDELRFSVYSNYLNGTDETLEKLLSQYEPRWPNSYTFSKCFSENIIMDKASDLPVAIIRPSIIICVWKSPLPGFIEDTSGISTLSIGTGKGFLKVIFGDPNVEFDIIPVDVVAHNHIVWAWSVATKRSPSPVVVNCTAFKRITFKRYIDIMMEMTKVYPLPKSYQTLTDVKITKSWMHYWCLAAWYHYIPAVVIDIVLRMHGNKLRIFNLYKFYDKAVSAVEYFVTHSWDMQKENIPRLKELLHPEDRNLFHIDSTDADLVEIANNLPRATDFFDWKTDKKSPQERKRVINRRYWLITGIQWIAVTSFCCFIYMLIPLCYKFLAAFFTET